MADLLLSGGEFLLECHVCGGEALVVEEERLDVAVLRGEAFFDEGRVRVGGGGGGWCTVVVEEETGILN